MSLPKSSPECPATVPSLSIGHLLLWMFGVAVIAAWHGRYGTVQADGMLWPLWAGMSSAAWGLSLAGLLLAVRHGIARRPCFPLTAGHWLLVIDGFVLVLSEVANTIADSWRDGRSERHTPIYFVSFFLMASAYCWGSFQMRDRLPWRLAMLALAIVPGYWALDNLMLAMGYARQGAALSSFGHKWQYWGVWPPIGAMLLMAAAEGLYGKHRDWLHWTGICGVACRIWLG